MLSWDPLLHTAGEEGAHDLPFLKGGNGSCWES